MTIEIGQSAPDLEIKAQFGQLVRPYAEAQRYEFPLLSDFWPHGAVADAYGVLRRDGMAERALIFIDRQGVITHIHVADINKRPPLELIVEQLKKMDGTR